MWSCQSRQRVQRRNNGWIHGKSRLPCEADGDHDGKILVWHAFQDAVVVSWNQFLHNRFHVYWMRIADLDDNPWICAMEKLPTQSDADKLNCVMVMDQEGHVNVTGYHQFSWNRTLTHWRTLPPPPSDAMQLRKMS